MDRELKRLYLDEAIMAFFWLIGMLVGLKLVFVFVGLTAHATQSQPLTKQQMEARRQMHIICTQGSPYTYSQCMVRGLQGQRLGVYVLTAPVPVVDVD